MKRMNKNDESKRRKKDSSAKKSNPGSPGHKEDFNTGSHSPSSLLNVGPGYDDTGMGNDSDVSDQDNKTVGSRQSKQKRNPGKN